MMRARIKCRVIQREQDGEVLLKLIGGFSNVALTLLAGADRPARHRRH
jgi:hypothetical protein